MRRPRRSDHLRLETIELLYTDQPVAKSSNLWSLAWAKLQRLDDFTSGSWKGLKRAPLVRTFGMFDVRCTDSSGCKHREASISLMSEALSSLTENPSVPMLMSFGKEKGPTPYPSLSRRQTIYSSIENTIIRIQDAAMWPLPIWQL